MIAYFAVSRPLQSRPCVFDFALISSSLLSPFLIRDIVGSLVWLPFHPTDTHEEKLKKSSELFFCISELLRCLCRKDPLITVYWAVRLWPHHTLNSSRPSQGPGDPSCPGLGNGFSGFDLFRLPLSYQESINTRPGATFAYETQV